MAALTSLHPDHKIAGILAPLFALRGTHDLGVGDVAALRGSLGRLLGDPARCRQMGARGLEMTSQIFSFEKYVDSLQSMLEELAAAPTPLKSRTAG